LFNRCEPFHLKPIHSVDRVAIGQYFEDFADGNKQKETDQNFNGSSSPGFAGWCRLITHGIPLEWQWRHPISASPIRVESSTKSNAGVSRQLLL
jgi:hypothetical protein